MLFQHHTAGLALMLLSPLVMSVVGVLATRTHGKGSAQSSVSQHSRALQKCSGCGESGRSPRCVYASVHFNVSCTVTGGWHAQVNACWAVTLGSAVPELNPGGAWTSSR